MLWACPGPRLPHLPPLGAWASVSCSLQRTCAVIHTMTRRAVRAGSRSILVATLCRRCGHACARQCLERQWRMCSLGNGFCKLQVGGEPGFCFRDLLIE